MKSKAIIGGIIALVILVIAIIFCIWAGVKINEKLSEINPNQPSPQSPENPTSPPTTSNDNLALGNPSNATQNPSNADNYLLQNNYYALSYNRGKAIANWVSWKLTAADLGKASRQNDFRPDERLPENWEKVTPYDFSGSGFDRGHICPSADRSTTEDANSATFLMTNIAPQTADLNQGPWEKLETYSRNLARRGGVIYIISGNYGARRERVKSKITIPTNFWKIVIVLPPNSNVSSINKDSRVIAVDMPNLSGIKSKNWRDYRTTVRNIEQKTGYDFLSNLPQSLQNALEIKVDMR
jgi:endonuclease G